ncbi:hypothetical protein HAX54_013870, partial [Datura stramonium]|nr:hypothetical protein [Datura stramonium]
EKKRGTRFGAKVMENSTAVNSDQGIDGGNDGQQIFNGPSCMESRLDGEGDGLS